MVVDYVYQLNVISGVFSDEFTRHLFFGFALTISCTEQNPQKLVLFAIFQDAILLNYHIL